MQGLASINVRHYRKNVMSPASNVTLIGGDNKFDLNTADLQNGIYFRNTSTANGKETVKLVVSH